MRKESGFTALELLIVIAIIAILLGITLASINLSRDRARDDASLSDIRTIMLSAEEYRATCGAYPADLTSANNGMGATSNCSFSVDQFIPQSIAVDNYEYVPLARTSNTFRCQGFHIGVQLDNTNNPALDNDSDWGGGSPWVVCNLGSGSVPTDDADGWYDIKQP